MALLSSCNSSRVDVIGQSTPAASGPGASTTETAVSNAWRQFSNDKYGFQFQYPASCAIEEADDSFYVGSRIALTVLNAGGAGLSDYVTRFVNDKAVDGTWKVESTADSSLAGRPAVTVEYRFGGQGRYGTATFTLRKANIFVWSLSAGGFSCDEPEIYSAVLDSFRFKE